MSCDVCLGFATYPVIDKYGSHLYDIRCPECFGTGESEDADSAKDREWEALAVKQAAKYKAAMQEKRRAEE